MQSQEWEDRIRQRAYEIYLDRNGAQGTEIEDWLRAESEMLSSRESAIDESSEESFPASDPPAY